MKMKHVNASKAEGRVLLSGDKRRPFAVFYLISNGSHSKFPCSLPRKDVTTLHCCQRSLREL